MEKITFTCETITPMFLAGADGMTPELRAPSIKGALRFWWRAMHGDLSLEQLKEREAAIFGGTSPAKRSSVIIKINNPLTEIFKTEMLPHRERAWKASAFRPNQEFTISFLVPSKIFDSKTRMEIFSIEKLQALFLLVSLLGGLGKRSRRGFGSFQVKKINGIAFSIDLIEKEVKKLIKQVNPKFSYSTSAQYPVIEKIEIGDKKIELKQIGDATHIVKANSKSYEYNATIGAGTPRFASPIYISILPNGKPIITTLKTVPPPKSRDVNESIQTNLKNRIL